MSGFVHYLAVVGVCWAVFCRARKMDFFTPVRLKLQHGAAMLLALASLPAWGLHEWGSALLAAALGIYLLVDVQRWQHGAPIGCPIDAAERSAATR